MTYPVDWPLKCGDKKFLQMLLALEKINTKLLYRLSISIVATAKTVVINVAP